MPAQDIFANTDFQGAITPSVAVQQPVQDNSASTFFDSVARGMDQAGQFFQANATTQTKAANSAVLVKFQEDVGLITDGMEGGMSVQEGRMRLRKLNSEYIANYPSMVKDINELQGKLTSTVGLANVIATGNEQVQAQRKIQQDALTNGWPDAQTYQAHLAANNANAVLTDQLNNKIVKYGLVTQDDKTAAYVGLKDIIKTGLPWINNRVTDYQSQVDSGTMKPEDAIAKLNAEVSKETAAIGQARGLSAGADKEADPSFLLTGIQDRLKAFTEYNNGSISKTVYDNQNATIQARDQLMIRQTDPTLAKQIALSNMLPPVANSPLLQQVTNRALDMMTKLEQAPAQPTSDGSVAGPTAKPVDLIDTSADIKDTLAASAASIKAMGANPTPEQLKSVNNVLTNVFTSLKRYGSTSEHPAEFNSVIDFLANPAVNAAVVKNGGIPTVTSGDAKTVISDNYFNVLGPLIKQRWDEGIAKFENMNIAANPMQGAKDMTMGQAIQPVWNGVGVEFRPAPGLEKNVGVVNAAKGLNKDIGPVLNTYIRAAATASGTSDYKGVYEKDIQDRLFNPDGSAANNGGAAPLQYAPSDKPIKNDALDAITGATSEMTTKDSPKDMKLEDFANGIEEATAVVKQSKAADPVATVNANSPMEFAQAYLGTNENNTHDAAVLSAFIHNAAGIDINPAKTAWCAAFVDAVLHSAGSKGTGKLNARSYETWGKAVTAPQVGDIVVFSRGGASSGKGHVGFYAGKNSDGTIRVLGGNQSDSVKVSNFSTDNVLSYRRAS